METKERLEKISIFCQKVGHALKLTQLTISTAIIYIYKFINTNDDSGYSDKILTCSCLLLAIKVEEASRRITTIIKGWKYVENPKMDAIDEET